MKRTSQEATSLDYPWEKMGSGDHNMKSTQVRHSDEDEKLDEDPSRDLSIVENALSRSLHCKRAVVNPANVFKLNACHEEISSDLKRSTSNMTKSGQGNSSQSFSGTHTDLSSSFLTAICNSMLGSSVLRTMFTMLMVGAGKNSPPQGNPNPRIILTPPKDLLRRPSPLSPPKKSPTRTIRETIDRIKAFPKIPKRQFTTPEKSPDKEQMETPQQPRPICVRQISFGSSSTTELPCGGFRLSRGKFRPPRDPFAIPEKFEPVAPQPVDFSQEPLKVIFPSLFFPEAKQDEDEKQSRDVTPHREVESKDAQSTTPENDNVLPESHFNPKRVAFPLHATEDEVVSMPKGSSKLGASYICSDFDPLEQTVQYAMKEFSNVYGQITSHMDHKITTRLQQMKEFMAQFRSSVLRINDAGAIVSTTPIPYDVTSCMGRINKLIDRLSGAKQNMGINSKYGFWMYSNLKYRPLNHYRFGTGASRLDDIHALQSITKTLVELITDATQVISSFRTEKKVLEKFLFGIGKKISL